MEEWQFDSSLKVEHLEASWDPLPFDDWFFKNEGVTYFIKEITDGKRLFKESKVLHHCVFSYLINCKNGYTHIFSLSTIINKVKTPFMTIEVVNNCVIQVSGLMNSQPNSNISKLIKLWVKENNLLSNY